VVLGHGGGGGAEIPARCSSERAGEGEEQGLGVTYDRSMSLIGAGSRLEDAAGGVRRWVLLELGLRRGGNAARATSKRGSSIGSQGRCPSGWTAGKTRGHRSSASTANGKAAAAWCPVVLRAEWNSGSFYRPASKGGSRTVQSSTCSRYGTLHGRGDVRGRWPKVDATGVWQGCRWLGGAGRFARPMGVRRVATGYWAQTLVRG
jgi:hypothetical protein